MPTEYRPCVVAVFTNKGGQILVGERSDAAGSWQLPQGGIDPGESALIALYREMREELGCDRFRVLKEIPSIVKYRFPEDLKSPVAQKWLGQAQYWFHTVFDETFEPNLSISDGEFSNVAWWNAKDVIQQIIEWKRPAYVEGFTKLGLL